MSIEKHAKEFIDALKGAKGDLDAWLEDNSEQEVRDAVLSVLCAKDAEIAELKTKLVCEFSHDTIPQFQQGVSESEVIELVTAERCANLVSIITERSKDADRFDWLIEQHWIEPEAIFRLCLSGTDSQSEYKDEIKNAIDAAIAREK